MIKDFIFHNLKKSLNNEFQANTNNKNCMRAMWRAVITQALIDASSNSRKKSLRIHRAKSRKWLLDCDEDFLTVCFLADLDPLQTQEKIRKALDRNCKWRRDSL
ncbi:hypothetical protein Cyrtocomes_00378 [Candidatus Cyrtobacter comes]|uniref:Uncharacterized protein n=1 Tax=Candidatus Cyrtobacter comes TaxID=675776 RepID=A0ABU5L7A3_9RICK|nr:hypothetical protein [Candidatus Cyrtobacter comes]MDZ5762012.1 hypothetical protein [Candidatus Cyrtobacter comes]